MCLQLLGFFGGGQGRCEGDGVMFDSAFSGLKQGKKLWASVSGFPAVAN